MPAIMSNGAVQQYRKYPLPIITKAEESKSDILVEPVVIPVAVESVVEVVEEPIVETDNRAKCDFCDFRANTEKGVKIHIGRSHKE